MRTDGERILYLDCFSGASGDMLLGALIDAGASREEIEGQLQKLHAESFTFTVKRVQKNTISATKISVHPDETAVVRYWRSIRGLLQDADLTPFVKENAIAAFQRLAEAEAKVHGKQVDQAHFHEVGAVDALVDIVGTMAALESLGVDRVIVSPLPTGIGMVKAEHGMLPIPAPATAELLNGVPSYSGGIPHELTTPTGAAIVTTIADEFGDAPVMVTESIGYGAGTAELDQPNVLRAMLGRAVAGTAATGIPEDLREEPQEELTVVETNIDDMNPEIYPYLIEKVEAAGAIEVWLTPVTMKKGRPGTVLSALVPREAFSAITEALLTESTTLGIRHYPVKRRILVRTVETVSIEGQEIEVKVGWIGDRAVNFAAEFEDCKRAAEHLGLPLKDLLAQASAIARGNVLTNERPRLHAVKPQS